jgi:hypothetical protein
MPRVSWWQGTGGAGRSRRCRGNVGQETTMRADLNQLDDACSRHPWSVAADSPVGIAQSVRVGPRNEPGTTAAAMIVLARWCHPWPNKPMLRPHLGTKGVSPGETPFVPGVQHCFHSGPQQRASPENCARSLRAGRPQRPRHGRPRLLLPQLQALEAPLTRPGRQRPGESRMRKGPSCSAPMSPAWPTTTPTTRPRPHNPQPQPPPWHQSSSNGQVPGIARRCR